MRLGFVAGQMNRTGSKLLIAPRSAPRAFPGPWQVAAVIRISDAGVPYPSGSSDCDAARSDSRAR